MQTWMHITHGMHDDSQLSHCRATNPREMEGGRETGGGESKNNQHEQKTTWRCQKLRSKERQKLQGSEIESGRWRRKHWWRLWQRMSNLGWIFILFSFILFIKSHLQWQRWCYVGENSVKVVLFTFYKCVTYNRTQNVCCEWLSYSRIKFQVNICKTDWITAIFVGKGQLAVAAILNWADSKR